MLVDAYHCAMSTPWAHERWSVDYNRRKTNGKDGECSEIVKNIEKIHRFANIADVRLLRSLAYSLISINF